MKAIRLTLINRADQRRVLVIDDCDGRPQVRTERSPRIEADVSAVAVFEDQQTGFATEIVVRVEYADG